PIRSNRRDHSENMRACIFGSVPISVSRKTSMTRLVSDLLSCPKCGSTKATLCGQSVEYHPEKWLGQSLKERGLHTLAYQCECGAEFTHTIKGETLLPKG